MALPASRPTRTKVVIVLPGILSTPLEKVGPVLRTIGKNADIAGIDYGTSEFDVDTIAANTANLIKDLADLLERWLDEVPTMEVVKVDTAHAAFLEAPITWNEVMDDLINK